ncbi:hypothetical protein [Pseudarthrobacter sulfonivorans]|nr:hypothetical protein [Pseudarthrobacter sulfonivorans]
MKKPSPRESEVMPAASGANLNTVRGIAISAGTGGLLLVAYAILMNVKPRGCIADECVGQSYRAAGPLESALALAAIGLMIATALGLYQMHRFEGRGARIVRIASLIAAASMLVGILGLVINNVFFNSGLVYFLVAFPGILLAMLAFAVTGAGLMRSRVMPPWAGAMLILTSLLLLVHNDQNELILLVIPFGVTWMVLGGLLWSTTASSSSRWHARIQHV